MLETMNTTYLIFHQLSLPTVHLNYRNELKCIFCKLLGKTINLTN